MPACAARESNDLHVGLGRPNDRRVVQVPMEGVLTGPIAVLVGGVSGYVSAFLTNVIERALGAGRPGAASPLCSPFQIADADGASHQIHRHAVRQEAKWLLTIAVGQRALHPVDQPPLVTEAGFTVPWKAS
jgi:hypothetical protein